MRKKKFFSPAGETFAFDGMQLFLTKKLEDTITYLKSVRQTDSQEFEISVKLVNALTSNQSFQLYNILFKKV